MRNIYQYWDDDNSSRGWVTSWNGCIPSGEYITARKHPLNEYIKASKEHQENVLFNHSCKKFKSQEQHRYFASAFYEKEWDSLAYMLEWSDIKPEELLSFNKD